MSTSKSKRGTKGTGSIRKRSSGIYEGRCTCGYDPKTGKQIQKSVYGKSKNEVRETLTLIQTSIDDGSYMEPSNMKLSDFIDMWMNEYTADKKYSTRRCYRAQIEAHIKPGLGNEKLSALSAPMIQRFYNRLVNAKTGERLSPKSAKNVHGILNEALSLAVRLGYIRSNPCSVATLPRIEKTEVVPLENDQIAKFIREAENDDVYGRLLKVTVFTGMREGEVMGLTWDDIDFARNKITIRHQLQKRPKADGGVTLASVKNDKLRVLAVPPSIMDILREQKLWQEQAKKAAGAAWINWRSPGWKTDGLVFTKEDGMYLSPQTVYNHLKTIVRKIGAPDATVHDLRHTYAMLSLQNGDDIKTLQGNLGHATAAFTLDRYGHISEKMKMQSADRMEMYIQNLA